MTNWNGRSAWNAPGGKQVRIGEFVFPRQVEWTFEGEGGDPDLRAVFEYRDGRPQCTSVQVTAATNGRGIRTSDLHALQADSMTISGFIYHARRSTFDPATNVTTLNPIDPQDEDEVRAALTQVKKAIWAPRQRSATQDELRQVAAVYLANANADPRAAVQTELGYNSARTADRRIKMAEEAGLLPKTTPGRKRRPQS